MDGKNCVTVDGDADLVEAVADCIESAFGYQGQKCSTLSQLIVLADNCDRFLERFLCQPADIKRAGNEFVCGNLYVNRPITGALVVRQPFGGFKMSGGGTKAGGRDYLQNFLLLRVITENCLRHGFAPENEQQQFCLCGCGFGNFRWRNRRPSQPGRLPLSQGQRRAAARPGRPAGRPYPGRPQLDPGVENGLTAKIFL